MTQLVPAASTGPVSAATVVTLHRGQFLLTAIAKATFSFAHQAELGFAPPLDVVAADVHVAKNPMCSVRVSSDLRPRLAHPEVTFVGRAHAPGGTPVERMTVRLGLASDTASVLAKRLEVVGDRPLTAERVPGAPEPFKEMALGYERALGGLGWVDNPLGVGATADSEGLPNIVYADPALQKKVAGFGPLAATWPMRKRLLGRSALPTGERLMELTEDFDWRFFQAAPPDQQLTAIPPQCWIVLEGLNPRHATLQMRLPACRVLARLDGPGGQMGVELVADSLFIDGDAEHCTVTWRGNFEIARMDALEGAWVGVVLQRPNEALVWPAPPERVPAAASAGPSAPPLAGTMLIAEPPPKRKSSVANLRAVMGGKKAGGSSLPPPTAPLPIVEVPPPDLAGTMLIAEPPATAPLPFAQAAPGASREGGAGGGGDLAGTMLIQEPVAAVSLPFAGAKKPPENRTSDRPAPLPGAPWAAGAAPPVVEARPDLSGTLIVPVPSPAPRSAPPPPAAVLAPPAPPAPVPPPPAPPAPTPPPEAPPTPTPPPAAPPAPPDPAPPAPPPVPEPEVKVPKHRDDPGVWAPQPETAPLAPPKPKPALPAKQNLSAGLYKGWKKS